VPGRGDLRDRLQVGSDGRAVIKDSRGEWTRDFAVESQRRKNQELGYAHRGKKKMERSGELLVWAQQPPARD